MQSIGCYEHVIWDFNGTILNDLELCLSIQRDMLAQRGLPPVSQQVYLDTFSFPIKNWYEQMGYDISSYDEIADAWAEIYEASAADCNLSDGFLALSGAFAARGIAQSILSASQQEQLDMLTGKLGIQSRFVHICGLDDKLGGSKTQRAQALANEIGLAPERLLFIGDTLHDLLSAQAIGCDCALVAQGHQSHARLKSEWHDVYTSFAELQQHLFR